jgi:tetratricopeptide (TPR) repeat protein
MKKVMISSTAVDLPDHRREAIEACLRVGFFPIAMEHLPAVDADAVDESVRMVDAADLYVGIYGHRYGTIPAGFDASITEMEFDRAVARGLPILVFVMHPDHPITIDMVQVETEAKENLLRLKRKVSRNRIRAEYRSAIELRGLIVEALSAFERREAVTNEPVAHRATDIPRAPKPYLAHRYVLLQTKDLIGRRDELRELTDWVTRNSRVSPDTRIFSIIAIGGMGKSALTWKWFEDIAPNELPNLAGRMWWSFYEQEATWDSFVLAALSYVSDLSEVEIQGLKRAEQEDRLMTLLDGQPFLIVLDGFERLLLAYSRLDAAHIPDEELEHVNDDQFLGGTTVGTHVEKHRLRQCADLRAGAFLRKLARVRASRILLSSRLHPAELETDAAKPLPGCYTLTLGGLTDDDALALWRDFIAGERSGTSEELLKIFNAFANYPLLLRALAGEVAQFRAAPGDFYRWRKAHSDFDPAAQLDLKNARTHVLEFALRGLPKEHRTVLRTISAFRMPANWHTLRALFVGSTEAGRHPAPIVGSDRKQKKMGETRRRGQTRKPCPSEAALDLILQELEDRGLVGWNKTANTYDLHPIVRSVVWLGVNKWLKRTIYRNLHRHFSPLSAHGSEKQFGNWGELSPSVELFNTLVGLERYDDAYRLYVSRLDKAINHRLGDSRRAIELVESLFVDRDVAQPRLQKPEYLASALAGLAMAHKHNGRPGLAVPLFGQSYTIRKNLRAGTASVSEGYNLSLTYTLVGRLRSAETAGRQALVTARQNRSRYDEAISLRCLACFLAAIGDYQRAMTASARARRLREDGVYQLGEGSDDVIQSLCCMLLGDPEAAHLLASTGCKVCALNGHERDGIRSLRLLGQTALALRNYDAAKTWLTDAAARARSIHFVEEELPALIAIAELNRSCGQYDSSREVLDRIWMPALLGPYPLWHADAFNILAQLERDQGHISAASEAAVAAYNLAWCDGPPYVYYSAFRQSLRHLNELSVPEPYLLQQSAWPSLPDVDLDPDDDFHVGVITGPTRLQKP